MFHSLISNIKMKLFFLLCVNISLVIAVPSVSQRIVGGSITSIDQRPYLTALLYSRDFVRYSQACGGSIITNTAILSAAHCFVGDTTNNWRARVGSTNANSGGVVHNLNRITIHEQYNRSPFDNDVAILRTTNAIAYNANVQPARIASPSYVLADNAVVWAIGWGTTSQQGFSSEQLRHVQIWTVNQAICRSRYSQLVAITDNMLCSGWLDVGGRDQCQGDSGGPLIHDNVVVGIASFGNGCAQPNYPGVNARVSRFTSWIQSRSFA